MYHTTYEELNLLPSAIKARFLFGFIEGNNLLQKDLDVMKALEAYNDNIQLIRLIQLAKRQQIHKTNRLKALTCLHLAVPTSNPENNDKFNNTGWQKENGR